MAAFWRGNCAVKPTGRRKFLLYLVKPSHYDDDGYVIQWLRAAIPSNSLAVLYGLVSNCDARKVLGPDVDIETVVIDETNARVRPQRFIREIKANGGFGMVGLVGVQSNQFPRALNIARPLREAGIQVCLGGFHVSGCLAMLPEMPDDMKEALAMGVSLFAGEGEGRIETVLQDAARGELKPVYNFMNDLPGIEGAPLPHLPAEIREAQALGVSLFAGEAEGRRLDAVLLDAFHGRLRPMYNFMNDLPGLEGEPPPFLPDEIVRRTSGHLSSIDLGRGCPYQCSFCTIINVQGRKSRYRSADDVEAIMRANIAQGI